VKLWARVWCLVFLRQCIRGISVILYSMLAIADAKPAVLNFIECTGISTLITVLFTAVFWRCWLGGRKGIRPVKNWVVGCWRGYLSEARCRLAYGPADATATHHLLLQYIQISFAFLVPAHPGSPGKRAIKRVCVCMCVTAVYVDYLCRKTLLCSMSNDPTLMWSFWLKTLYAFEWLLSGLPTRKTVIFSGSIVLYDGCR